MAQESPLLQLDPAQLVLMFPGVALWLGADGQLLHSNPAGEPLAAALMLGECAPLAHLVQASLRDGLARQESLSLPLQTGAGDARIFHLTLLPLPDAHGIPQLMVLGREVSLERNMLRALLASRQLFRDLVSCSSDFAWECDRDGRFTFVSPGGALGFAAEELVGQSARGLAAQRAEDSALWPFETQSPLEQNEFWLKRKDGRLGCFSIAALPVTDAQGYWAGARGVARDITAAREQDAALRAALAKVRSLSETDALTGLLNRRAFMEKLTRALGQDAGGTLLYCDLDHFKAVNDVRGHAAGDALLRAVAALLQEGRRASDLAARLGGDEFALWLAGAEIAVAQRVAEQLAAAAAALAAQYSPPGAPFGISVGFGVALPGFKPSADDLLAQADAAMYRQKKTRKAQAGA